MQAVQIREATPDDVIAIYNLFRAVARSPGGLARLESEINQDYIGKILQNASLSGLMLLATVKSAGEVQIAGSIHAYTPGLYCFSHVLSELTIAVHPERQGSGVGRLLFTTFMKKIDADFSHISRVELISRQSNQKAIAFYKTLGFVQEGELSGRIKNVDGSLESDIPMAWTRASLAT